MKFLSKTLDQTFRYSWAALLIVSLSCIFLIAEWNKTGDFRIFLLASEALSEGKDIYAITYLDGFHYFYSPLFALLIWPLTLLPVWTACILWKALSIVMVSRLFVLFSKVSQTELIRSKAVFLSLILVASPLFSSFHNVQMSVFLLYIIFESSYQALIKERVIIPALLLGFAINIKIMPVVLIAYWLYRSAFLPSLVTFIAILLFTFLPSLIIGQLYNETLLESWWALLNPGNQEHIFDISERGLHGLSSWITALFTDKTSMNELTHRRHLILLEESTVIYIIQAARAFLVAGMFYFLRTWPFIKRKASMHMLWELSYLCAIIPLIFPHQQIYGFAFLLPASFYLITYALGSTNKFTYNKFSERQYALMFFAFLFVNGDLLFGMIRKELWFFKVLTYGALLLILLLATAVPFPMENSQDVHSS